MPVCTIHLLSLNKSLSTFAARLNTSHVQPLVTAKVARWIITPSHLSRDSLLGPSQPWDVLLILEGSVEVLPAELQDMVKDKWSIQAGVPSKLVSAFESTNTNLLHPPSGEVPSLTGALSHPTVATSSQNLELSDELRDWILGGRGPKGAVSMLNLLAFKSGKKSQYLKYGKAFAESIGARRGGLAKIVGKVVPGSCSDGCDEWEEVALAHYPSLTHFADMIASEDYQKVNFEYRVPSLRDTFILCTSELGLEQTRQKAVL